MGKAQIEESMAMTIGKFINFPVVPSVDWRIEV